MGDDHITGFAVEGTTYRFSESTKEADQKAADETLKTVDQDVLGNELPQLNKSEETPKTPESKTFKYYRESQQVQRYAEAKQEYSEVHKGEVIAPVEITPAEWEELASEFNATYERIEIPAGNYDKGRLGPDIDGDGEEDQMPVEVIVMHRSEDANVKQLILTMKNGSSKKSYHVGVTEPDENGQCKILQFVDTNDTAFHAGTAVYANGKKIIKGTL